MPSFLARLSCALFCIALLGATSQTPAPPATNGHAPRLYLAAGGISLSVWALRDDPDASTFTYYYIEYPGATLKSIRYSLRVGASPNDMHLTLSRNGHVCRTYHATFFDDDKKLIYINDPGAYHGHQAFQLSDDHAVAQMIESLQSTADMDAKIYRAVGRPENAGGPSYHGESWFAPKC